jgi:hypothetical protein
MQMGKTRNVSMDDRRVEGYKHEESERIAR